MVTRLDSELVVGALQMAVTRLQPKPVIHHSDHGSQYTSQHFLAVCQRTQVPVSMGDCYDNAIIESFFATLETESIDQQPRRCFHNHTQAQMKIFDYVEDYYNPRRRLSALGQISPVEYERRYYQEVQ